MLAGEADATRRSPTRASCSLPRRRGDDAAAAFACRTGTDAGRDATRSRACGRSRCRSDPDRRRPGIRCPDSGEAGREVLADRASTAGGARVSRRDEDVRSRRRVLRHDAGTHVGLDFPAASDRHGGGRLPPGVEPEGHSTSSRWSGSTRGREDVMKAALARDPSLKLFLMMSRGRGTSEYSAVDCAVMPGATVCSPVDGTVRLVKRTSSRGAGRTGRSRSRRTGRRECAWC